MKKIFGIFSLAVINFSVLYLVYWATYIASSIKADNILHIPYEPSGMQLFFYIISPPFFMILALCSLLHSYYFNLRKSLCSGIFIIWFSYFILILYMDLVLHFSIENYVLYYGSLFISLGGICYVIYSTYCQYIQLTKSQSKICTIKT